MADYASLIRLRAAPVAARWIAIVVQGTGVYGSPANLLHIWGGSIENILSGDGNSLRDTDRGTSANFATSANLLF